MIKNTLALLSLLILGTNFAQDQSSFSLTQAEDFGVNNNEKMKNDQFY